ncbi:hypothetical protein TEA_018364 [Camellia sinensis var. sinensis]|uniref:Uncharacterized protein n=1 Tax=Camellia sinensis var. sinensis TaxID=542762 RepID=A0A4S4DL88_CAMSN|nr:hypothetical protein TEA_018364 [Camellia sinensis var. sinensis]
MCRGSGALERKLAQPTRGGAFSLSRQVDKFFWIIVTECLGLRYVNLSKRGLTPEGESMWTYVIGLDELKEMGNSVLGRFGMSIDNVKAIQDPNTDELKEMGNSVLGRFGMSIDNFKAVQDPNTGSYSISFQR